MYHSKLVTLLLVSFVLNLCTGAVIYPKSLQTRKGSVSNIPISVLTTNEQTGEEDDWYSYIEFYGERNAYQGEFTFDASSVDASSVGAYSLDVNFKGPKGNYIVWTFEFFDVASDSWVRVGDNNNVESWKWSYLSFVGTTQFCSLVSSDNTIKVRLTNLRSGDNCDIDYLAITTTESSTTGSVPSTTKPVNTEAPATQPPTEAAATQPPTKAPTRAPVTQPPTQPPTKAPTTQPATQPPTKAPATQPPTKAPATRPPTQPPTKAPATQAPATQAPTQPATKAPTRPPTSSTTGATNPSGRICPAGQIWAPAPGTTWQWQLTGTIDISKNVQMYDIDLYDASVKVISDLHAKGIAVICYFSTQYENWRPDASSFPSSDLGANLDDWPGERFVNIRSAAIRQVMKNRLDLAVTKGCDGVEPDNVDGYQNSNGISPKLTAADQLDFNKFFAIEAHKRGLSIGLKNDLDQVKQLEPYFDWALNEQCNEYNECDTLVPFVTAGKAVFGVEYSSKASSFCPSMLANKFSWLEKKLALGSEFIQCCTDCKPAPYRCYTPTAKREVIEESVPVVDEVVAEISQPVEFHSAATSTIPVVVVVLAFAIALVL